ncbi:MAG: zinc ribbon domain-containing protein [Chloroflexi bacterium]|nr:zinc ribbon domain-containing protein [Chloroflexota bacterium]
MPESLNDMFLVAFVFAAVVAAAFWLAIVIWASRDMRMRSRDPVAPVLVGSLVFLLNLPGLLIYVLLRPRETLSEVYERSLEEEALLQEIEERPSCPGCGQRVQPGWQVCPHCHHRLKKACVDCGYLLELPWNICPRCATSQITPTSDGTIPTSSRHVQPAEPAPIDARWVASQELD